MKRLIFASLFAVSSFAHADWRGALISGPEQLAEIRPFSNSFSYAPSNLEDLKNILDINNGELMPIIEIRWYFFDETSGIFKAKDAKPLLDAISNHKLMMLVDEPFWWIRMACQEGKPLACAEIANNYRSTRELFKEIKLRSGFQLFHVEAYRELILQKQANPFQHVIMLESADHIGFDCYGPIDNCEGHSQLEYASWIFDAMLSHQRMFLVPGAFNYTNDIGSITAQLDAYFSLYIQYRHMLSAIHVFTWGDFQELIGARNIPLLKQKVDDLLSQLN